LATREPKLITTQGVELIDLAIASVRRNPRPIAGFCGDYPLVDPHPLSAEVLERLTFPSGKPLPPSLTRWLTFDASWLQRLGWFASLDPPMVTSRWSLQGCWTWRAETIWCGTPYASRTKSGS
jgi:hypothetical protein